MKITIFSQHFWPENFRINDLAFKLFENGFKVNVFTGKPNYPSGKIKKKYKGLLPKISKFKKVEIIRFPILSRGESSYLRLSLNYISYIFSVSLLGFFYKKKFGDILFIYATSPIFQAIPAILFGKIFKIKIVLWVQDLWPHNLQDTGYIKNKLILLLIDFIVNKIYDLSDLILCQSDSFTNFINRKTKTKVKTFHNPSNYKFSVTKKRNKSGYFKIFYAGNLGRGQNLENIIEIFKNKKILKKKIRFVIYGSGKKYKPLKKIINNKKITNVFLNKAVSPKKLKEKMRNADCFLLKLNDGPGLSKTIPAKFQTYLSFGKPILSINKGTVSNLVNKFNVGYTCQNDSNLELTNLILNIKKLSKKKTEIIAKNSRNLFFSKFEINNSCKKLKKYLEELK
tara:strand:- start:1474 stop:2664 length:1191 start_codon:yes stop_codon:yes gene_type:complete